MATLVILKQNNLYFKNFINYCATCFMLHNKGNTILIMTKTLVATPQVLSTNILTNMSLYIVVFLNFYTFKLYKFQFYNFYYQFTTFESKNIRNYENIC